MTPDKRGAEIGVEMTDGMLLRARGVAKSYNGVPALRDGRLDLRAGSIHALCGGNGAGKSTFINIVMGLADRDAGEILIDGRPVRFAGPGEALAAGLAVITQELSLVDDMTVAENIALGREPKRAGFVDYRAMTGNARTLLDRLNFPIKPGTRVGDLSVARKQLVEIARAISYNSRVLIMDEPTSALGESDTRMLFDAIAGLKPHGVGIVYVSHRLSELFEIADDYTVFRDGRFVQSGPMASIDRAGLVQAIVGRALHHREARPAQAAGQPALAVDNLSRKNEFDGVSLEVGRGEILGIYGLVGSGRSEFMNCLYGLTRADRGTVTIDGAPVRIEGPRAGLAHGLALVTEDRKDTGLVACRPVRENITLASLASLSWAGIVQRGRERREVRRLIEALGIRTASPELTVDKLSGGNQQKVVFARCLMSGPTLLLCDEPTRGVDEGAKQQIYQLIEDFVGGGRAAIVVSSELDEILQICDRIIVFRGGRAVAEVPRAEATHQTLTHLAA